MALFKKENDGSDWLPISDLMSVLMMIFLLIAVIYIQRIEAKKALLREKAETYVEIKESIYKDLLEEFASDTAKWNATINASTLTISFRGGNQFVGTTDILSSEFKSILDSFIPRYLNRLNQGDNREYIDELRVEGHASTEGSYMTNMSLSQNRSLSVLKYFLNHGEVRKSRSTNLWLQQSSSASGLSSSRPIIAKDRTIKQKKMNRRVEFIIKLAAERELESILDL